MSIKKIITRTPVDSTSIHYPNSVSPLLQRVYNNRGLHSNRSLERTLVNLLPPKLMGITAAVDILLEAITSQKALIIIGDFDADGATSSALAVLALKAFGLKNVEFLVPNRFDYGYGLTPEIVAEAAKQHPDIIVTVDNGIASVDGVAAANELGIKVVVTDHHLPGEVLPEAAAIVNPNQHGCDFSSKNLAGVGVIFYVMSALCTALKKINWFKLQGIAEPKMAIFLDLVALGTVADVVPLDDNNRILVHQGLLRIRAGCCRPGILALLQVAGRDKQTLVASDLGFAIGPRLNAAGRLDDMALGIDCLLADDFNLACSIASELDELNKDRKAIEASMQVEAMESLKAIALTETDMPWGLCLYDASCIRALLVFWHRVLKIVIIGP